MTNKKAWEDAGFEVLETKVDVNDLFNRIDHQIELVESDAEEYIEHEEYTLEEQRYDEGYVNALKWANLMIGEVLFRTAFKK